MSRWKACGNQFGTGGTKKQARGRRAMRSPASACVWKGHVTSHPPGLSPASHHPLLDPAAPAASGMPGVGKATHRAAVAAGDGKGRVVGVGVAALGGW